MKITIIHGEYTTSSRERYFKIMATVKSRGWEVVHLNSGNISALDKLTTTFMFNNDQLFVIDNLDKIPLSELKWLKKNENRLDTNLLIWHKKELGKKLINELPKNTSYELFQLPKLIFSFLDDLKPGNSKSALKKLQMIKKTEPVEFILALIANTLRDMMVAKESGKLPYQLWRISKIKTQAAYFSKNNLKKFINDLALADVEAKTGGVSLDISLDLILLKHLE